MLTRNSQIEKLLEEGDFNIRVTTYDPTRLYPTPAQQKGAWVEVIRDSIGGGIVNTTELYSLSIKTADKVLLINLHVRGCDIARTIHRYCDHPQPIRITLSGMDSYSKRVWIIV